MPTRVLFTMIPELKGGLGAEYPVGLSFSTKEDINKAIAYNAGLLTTSIPPFPNQFGSKPCV